MFECTSDMHLTSPLEWSLLGALCGCDSNLRLRGCGSGLVVMVAKGTIAGCGVGYPCTRVVSKCIHSKRRDKNCSKQLRTLLSSLNISLRLLYLASKVTNS